MNIQEIVETCIKNPLSAIGAYGPIFLIIINMYFLRDIYFWLCIYVLFVGINTLLNTGLKELIKDPRPYNAKLFSSKSYGMPSGHTQSAMFSAMFYYLMFDIDEILYFMLFITGITSFQRYYDSNHTLLQILVGLCVGGAFAWIVYYFVKKYKSKLLMINNISA